MFSTVVGDASKQDDARSVRDLGISMVAVGLVFGGWVFARGLSDRDWIVFVAVLLALVGLALVGRFALGMPLVGAQPRSRRMRRAYLFALIGTLVLASGSPVLDDGMHGDVVFWAVAGLVTAAVGIGTGWWVLRQVPVAPDADARR
jgi:hypothetical protein